MIHVGRVFGFQVRLLKVGPSGQMLLTGGKDDKWIFRSWIGANGFVNLKIRMFGGSVMVSFSGLCFCVSTPGLLASQLS